MNQIQVYLQYPWGVSDSQYYKSLLDNPPLGIKYLNSKDRSGIITNRKKFILSSTLRRSLRRLLEKINFPIPNAKLTKIDEKFDLIHNAHCLSLNKSPWVADFESLWQMWISGRGTKKGIKKVKKIINQKNCKNIIAWTEHSKNEIISRFPEIEKKIEVIPYAMKFPSFKKITSKKIRLLFVSRYFFHKGGLHALEIFDRLTKEYPNVEATIVSDIPPEIKNKYSKNRKIKFYKLIPYKKLLEDIYPSIDILVYPGYSDTFGFVFVEALAFGIPVVTADGFSRKDLVMHNKTGFIAERDKNLDPEKIEEIEEKTIKQMINYTKKLITNESLRSTMSKYSQSLVKKGKFSLEYRNEKLKKVYTQALK